jgi:hypothetical protein
MVDRKRFGKLTSYGVTRVVAHEGARGVMSIYVHGMCFGDGDHGTTIAARRWCATDCPPSTQCLRRIL